jgi:phosphatidylinositol alpha-mannosyltransferase
VGSAHPEGASISWVHLEIKGWDVNIAVFSYGLPVVGEKRGGIERVAHDLADGLARRGHEVTVWTHDPKPASAAYEVRPLPWRRFVNTWVGRRVTMGYLGNVLALLPDYDRVDGIIAHGDSLLLGVLGRPVIRVMHGSALAEALAARSVWRFLLQMGVYVQELLTGIVQPGCVGVSANTCRYNPFVRRFIPNGVDLRDYYPDATAKADRPSVLFVGTLDGRKRGRLLLDWFEGTVRRDHPQATLDMVCPPGPPRPGVTYHTGVGNAELAALYRRAWVYASPSSYEGFGLPYVEALASGTPVVATPNPGSREVLGAGEFGVLADDADFPAALGRLLADAALRRQYATRGLGRAREFALETVIERYEALLGEGPSRRGRRGHGRRRA